MSIEMASEAMEIITMSVDKHAALKNYEVHTSFFVNWIYKNINHYENI